MELKVGDRIRVLEVGDDGEEYYLNKVLILKSWDAGLKCFIIEDSRCFTPEFYKYELIPESPKEEVKPKKNIYNMALHDKIIIGEGQFLMKITRVSGGWVYNICTDKFGETHGLVFVPYSGEFTTDKISYIYDMPKVQVDKIESPFNK